MLYYLIVSDLKYPTGLGTFLCMKEFKTLDEQIELLTSRGIIIEDEELVKEVLLKENYYNIINGYKDLFLDDKELYHNGTTFTEIYALYDFDRKLRSIFLEYILKIENTLRSLIAYYFPMHYGEDNYLNINSFDNYMKVKVSIKTKEEQLKHIEELIANINKKIASSISSKPYVKHYMINYGFIPPWIMVKIISFGELSNFYKLMNQKEREEIAKNFNIKEKELVKMIEIIAYVRNLCAHNERVYNNDFPTRFSINDDAIHEKMGINKVNDRYVCGKNDLFGLMISLKKILSSSDYDKLDNKIYSAIKSLESRLKTIEIDMVVDTMNLPSNWHLLKNIEKD